MDSRVKHENDGIGGEGALRQVQCDPSTSSG